MLDDVSVDAMALPVADVDSRISQSRLAEFVAVVGHLSKVNSLTHGHICSKACDQLLLQVSKKIFKAAFAIFLAEHFLWDDDTEAFAYLLMDLVDEIAMLKSLVSISVEQLLLNITCWNSA